MRGSAAAALVVVVTVWGQILVATGILLAPCSSPPSIQCGAGSHLSLGKFPPQAPALLHPDAAGPGLTQSRLEEEEGSRHGHAGSPAPTVLTDSIQAPGALSVESGGPTGLPSIPG